MPTYEYECKKCGNFDLLQGIKSEPIKKCPTCGGKVHRLIGGGSGIIFKGSGFYETDYKRKSAGSSSDSSACPGASSNDKCKSCPSNRKK